MLIVVREIPIHSVTYAPISIGDLLCVKYLLAAGNAIGITKVSALMNFTCW